MLDLLFLSDNLAISIFSAVFHKFVSSDLCGSSTNGGKLFSPKYPPGALASVLGCVVTLQLGAFSVVLETTLSGITALPLGAFAALMQPIHLAIGLVEGLITAAVLLFVYQTRPELLQGAAGTGAKNRCSRKAALAILAAAALVIGGGLSLLASSSPDGLEWSLFPVAGYQLAGLPMRLCFQKLRMVLPLVCAVGLLNPLFDRQIVVQVGTLAVSGGVLSMLTLILKGVFCLLASFLLMATTTIEAICRALRQLHVPKLLTNLLLLTFRSASFRGRRDAAGLQPPRAGAEGDSYFRVGLVSRPAAAAQHGSGAGALREYGVARVQRRIPRRCARTRLGGVVAVCTRVSGADAAGSLF